MTRYYFVATAVPALRFDEPPDTTFSEVIELYQVNLTERDYAQVETLRRLIDIYNLLSFWQNEPFDPHGNLSKIELEEALLVGDRLPQYVFEFLEIHQTDEERVRHFGWLLSQYFQNECKCSGRFLRKMLQKEREMRLVLTAFRAKRLGRDIAVELQYEDPWEDLIAQILAQKDTESYEPPEKYEGLKEIFADYGDQPMELFRALARFRFEKIDAMLEGEIFSLGYLLGYLAQLMILERVFELEKVKT